MTKTLIGVSVAVLAVIAIFALYLSPKTVRVVDQAIGGPDVYSYFFVHGPFSDGGGITTVTPTSATVTLTAAQMVNSNVITFTASTTQAALTATLPASTTFPLPRELGATRRWIIENPFTAAATTTTIAAGTGINLQIPETTGADVVININDFAYVTCTRGADTGAPADIVCRVDETIDGD